MKNFVTLLGFIPFFFAAFSSSALAKDINTKAITEKPSPQTTNIESIVVSFLNNVEFDAGANKQRPIVLRTVEPVYNNAGKVVIPANSRVEAVLVPVGKGKDKGTMIFAKSLIMNGKSYALNATASTVIPANKIPVISRMEQAANYSSSFARFSPIYTGFTGGTQSSEYLENTLIFQGIGAVVGFSSPRSKLASRIPQGSEHVLHLQQPLSLDTSKNIPVIANNSPIPQEEIKFSFRDKEEYDELVQKVLVAYQQKAISQVEARHILESANQYVRTEVNPILYPDENLRTQVSQLIGFNYAIDQKQSQTSVN
ncbi:MAG: hypothetical protein HC836_32330 [Richelia sp. RM2_1_2]|nr:hypothetical protein [Calothrix sp. SM1_7_51]NJL80797.1 hypothetical protein [Richelia sp. SM2_1_7]NJN11796.1 hypothetical protein [Richelia sp. RM1_1_1]NJO29443.1 hypothetical protein [Richelia sp. SL_2_1]NJO62748.1 hypothetical protein [Richelia sp. RM2_1_2]